MWVFKHHTPKLREGVRVKSKLTHRNLYAESRFRVLSAEDTGVVTRADLKEVGVGAPDGRMANVVYG